MESPPKMLNLSYHNSFSNLFSVYLKPVDNLKGWGVWIPIVFPSKKQYIKSTLYSEIWWQI